ncbi:hypothetical protein [Roseibium aggregatum]|uniref:hypothetical protein n=1 Tax=Roseibium aggregatum TaxID=187304 RepID=UPI000A88B25C|nr:hypothetical protein [Roseibium aggregatum]UFI03007.1 hypothetical protein ST40_023815 [Roseibium aggregatum]
MGKRFPRRVIQLSKFFKRCFSSVVYAGLVWSFVAQLNARSDLAFETMCRIFLWGERPDTIETPGETGLKRKVPIFGVSARSPTPKPNGELL